MTTIISAVYENRVEMLADGGVWAGRPGQPTSGKLTGSELKIRPHTTLPLAMMVRGVTPLIRALEIDVLSCPAKSVDEFMKAYLDYMARLKAMAGTELRSLDLVIAGISETQGPFHSYAATHHPSVPPLEPLVIGGPVVCPGFAGVVDNAASATLMVSMKSGLRDCGIQIMEAIRRTPYGYWLVGAHVDHAVIYPGRLPIITRLHDFGDQMFDLDVLRTAMTLDASNNEDDETTQIALMNAELLGRPVSFGGGSNGSGRADRFANLDQIDVAGATNLDTSEVGVLKPDTTGTSVAFGTPAASDTFNPSTGTFVNRIAALPNSTLIQTIGILLTAAGEVSLKIVREDSSTQYDFLYSETFTHGGNGWQDFFITTPFLTEATGTYRLAAYANNGPTRNLDSSGNRATIVGNQGVADNVAASAVSSVNLFPMRAGYGIATLDMTVASEAFDTVDPPEQVTLLALIDEVDAALIGDDYTFEVTRDGTDWAIIDMAYVITDNGLKQYWGVADVSDLDSGTTVKWRMSTTAVMVNLHGYAISWK